MGYCPWGLKELDTTERLSTAQCVLGTELSTHDLVNPHISPIVVCKVSNHIIILYR